MARPIKLGNPSQDRSAWWMLLFVLLGVLAPAGCVVWFMNEAAQSQGESARQSVTEAYRSQLRFVRDRVEGHWKLRATNLESSAGKGTPADFFRSINGHVADSLIYLDGDGSVLYPAPLAVLSSDTAADRRDWREAETLEQRRAPVAAANAYSAMAKAVQDPSLVARAAQAQIRLLFQANDKAGALRAIEEHFVAGLAAQGHDLQGRLIAADEHLLALRLLRPGDRRRAVFERRLVAQLNGYANSMPSAQRLFLMSELVELGAKPDAFPTYQAERLAAQFLESDSVRSAGSGLEATRVPGLWKLQTKDRRVIALYRAATVLSIMKGLLEEHNASPSVQFAAVAPGETVTGDALAAGAVLPGWQVSFSLTDPRLLDEAGRSRMTAYLSAGYFVIAAMVLTGLLVGGSFRRQMRLARLKTDLVAAVSHELKTPLASMRLLVDSLLDDPSPDPQKTREYLQLISGENMRLTRLIENFLTFSRIERNRHRFEFRPTDPSHAARIAVNTVRERFQDAVLHLDIERDLPMVRADEDALVTVLLNLLDNAYKYTPGEKRILLRAYRDVEGVAFAVEDNGIGIPPREQKRIFRKFYQVDQRLARETGGCGLGLSIVDFIVRAHGGAVSVKSEFGAGSTFIVSLPAGAAA